MRKTMFAVLLIACAFLVSFASIRSQGREHPKQAQEYPKLKELAETWVPFSATMRFSGEGVVPSEGRFWRFSDGSTRSETYAAKDMAITINNVAARRVYSCTGASGWVSHPLELPADGLHPLVLLATPGVRELPEKWEGLTVYAVTDAEGTERVIAPAINGFVVRRTGSKGPNVEVTDIVIGEPGVALTPPEGAPVVEKHDVRRMGAFPLAR